MTEAVEKHIKKLQRLDKKDELEVEHLLKVLKTPSKEYIAPLREMAEQWKNNPPPQEGVLFVPYAEWVEAICIYLEEGTQGLVKAIDKPKEFFHIAFGVLEEIPVSEAFTAFLEIAKTFSTGITDEQEDFVKKYAYSLCCISHQLKGENVGKDLHDAKGNKIDRAPNPMELLTIKVPQPVEAGDMVRALKEGLINLYKEDGTSVTVRA